jgi:hypothetical protein
MLLLRRASFDHRLIADRRCRSLPWEAGCPTQRLQRIGVAFREQPLGSQVSAHLNLVQVRASCHRHEDGQDHTEEGQPGQHIEDRVERQASADQEASEQGAPYTAQPTEPYDGAVSTRS